MSSSSAAAVKAARRPARSATTRAAPATVLSADAVKLAAAIERALAKGDHKGISQRFRETGSMLAAWPGER